MSHFQVNILSQSTVGGGHYNGLRSGRYEPHLNATGLPPDPPPWFGRFIGRSGGALGTGWPLLGGHRALRLGAIGQPDVEHRMLDGVQSGALGEHPAGKHAFLLAIERGLVDLDERGRFRRLGRRARITGARSYP